MSEVGPEVLRAALKGANELNTKLIGKIAELELKADEQNKLLHADMLGERIAHGCIAFSQNGPRVTLLIMDPETKLWTSGYGDTVTQAFEQIGK